MEYKCPSCGGKLNPVVQANFFLNPEQWDATKAGDYYCGTCPESAGQAGKSRSGYAYFWERQLK